MQCLNRELIQKTNKVNQLQTRLEEEKSNIEHEVLQNIQCSLKCSQKSVFALITESKSGSGFLSYNAGRTSYNRIIPAAVKSARIISSYVLLLYEPGNNYRIYCLYRMVPTSTILSR